MQQRRTYSAKPSPAGVALPSSATATRTGGPVISSERSFWRSGRFATRTASLREVDRTLISVSLKPASSSPSAKSFSS